MPTTLKGRGVVTPLLLPIFRDAEPIPKHIVIITQSATTLNATKWKNERRSDA